MKQNIIGKIVRYNNDSNLKIVSKEFQRCIEKKHKVAIKIIESWYKSFPRVSKIDNFKNKGEAIRVYNFEYPTVHLLNLPEFMVRKCRLNSNLLNNIPNKRNRKDVIKWMGNNEITLDIILWNGW